MDMSRRQFFRVSGAGLAVLAGGLPIALVIAGCASDDDDSPAALPQLAAATPSAPRTGTATPRDSSSNAPSTAAYPSRRTSARSARSRGSLGVATRARTPAGTARPDSRGW